MLSPSFVELNTEKSLVGRDGFKGRCRPTEVTDQGTREGSLVRSATGSRYGKPSWLNLCLDFLRSILVPLEI